MPVKLPPPLLSCRVLRRSAAVALGLFLGALPCVAAKLNVIEFGAVADGRTVNSAAFNRAIGVAAKAGGGTVVVPSGRFVTGTIYLQSHVTLLLENGAEIVGSTELADYPENPLPAKKSEEFRRLGRLLTDNLEYGRHSLIFAAGQSGIAVVGQGKIVGQGDHPNLNKRALRARGVPEREAYLRRPYGICFVNCTEVKVQGITFENMAFWCQDYLDCDGVQVDGVTVNSKQNDANNDGIDLDGSRHVRVSNCNFNSGDDSICLKASYADCEDVTITNCTVSSLANGVKFGTASNGGFRNIAISNITMNAVNAAGLALEVVDGGTLDGVVISNIAMNRVGTAIFVRLGDRGSRWLAAEAAGRPPVGKLRNVSISGVVATQETDLDNRPLSGSITGLPGHPVENIALSNIKLMSRLNVSAPETKAVTLGQVQEHEADYPEYSMFGALPSHGLFIRHARGVSLRNCQFEFAREDFRSALVCDDVENLVVDGFASMVVPGSHPVIQLHDVRGALLMGAMAPVGTGTFLRLDGRTAHVTMRSNDLGHAQQPIAVGDGLELKQVVDLAPP